MDIRVGDVKFHTRVCWTIQRTSKNYECTLIWLIRGTSLIHSFPQFEKPLDSCEIPHEQLPSVWFSMGLHACLLIKAHHHLVPATLNNARRLSTMSRRRCNSNCAVSDWSEHEGTMEPRIRMLWTALLKWNWNPGKSAQSAQPFVFLRNFRVTSVKLTRFNLQ